MADRRSLHRTIPTSVRRIKEQSPRRTRKSVAAKDGAFILAFIYQCADSESRLVSYVVLVSAFTTTDKFRLYLYNVLLYIEIKVLVQHSRPQMGTDKIWEQWIGFPDLTRKESDLIWKRANFRQIRSSSVQPGTGFHWDWAVIPIGHIRKVSYFRWFLSLIISRLVQRRLAGIPDWLGKWTRSLDVVFLSFARTSTVPITGILTRGTH